MLRCLRLSSLAFYGQSVVVHTYVKCCTIDARKIDAVIFRVVICAYHRSGTDGVVDDLRVRLGLVQANLRGEALPA